MFPIQNDNADQSERIDNLNYVYVVLGGRGKVHFIKGCERQK